MALPMAQLYLFCAKFFPEYKEFLVVKNEYSFSRYPPPCPALCPAQICCCSVGSQFSSVTQSCPTLCEPMDCSTPGFPVHHQFPELGQTHVHWVSDAVQPSHPLLSPSLAFNLSQHWGLSQWVSSLHQVAEVLEIQLQHQSFQFNIQDWSPLGLVWSPCSPRDSQESSPTTVWKHQFFRSQPSLWRNSHIHTWLLEKP